MLSIGKLNSDRANYYVDQLPSGQDEYYLAGETEGRAQWLGRAADRLGLAGDVTPDAFRNLLDACDPITGDPLGVPATTARRVAGFDLCFSAPKSVSVAWALGSPDIAEAITAAHDRAVASAVVALESEVIRARRGAGGHHLAETEGVAAAAFAHRSSRAGDPQLHTHVVVPNLTPDRDGRWTAVYGARVYRWGKTLGYLYQAELRAELTRSLGVTWAPAHNGAADLAAIPAELCREFSTRRTQIEHALTDAGASSASAAQTATLATRAAKHTVPELEQLRRDWAERAAALGIDEQFMKEILGPQREAGLDLDQQEAELLGPAGLTAGSSTFDRRAVIQAVAASSQIGADITDIRAGADQVLAQPEIVALPGRPSDHGIDVYTTADLLDVERRLVERAVEHHLPPTKPVTPADLDAVLAERPTLTDEQRHLVASLTTSDAAVQLVVGRAGTGKTYALDAAREAWQRARRPVIGAALAARAAAELQAGAGIPSTTIERFLADLDRPGPLSGLAPGTVVVVDEAAMVGTRQLARLLDHTLRDDASLVLVGDHRQLPEIAAGGAFVALANRVPTVELTANRRQAQAWERHALDELRAGSVVDAVAVYHDHGRLHLAPNAEAAREEMVADWYEAQRTGERAAMYALRRADVADLNQRARQLLQVEGLLGRDQLQAAGRDFAEGDQVLCLRNDRRLGVRNGTQAVIQTINPDRSVTLDDGTRLPARYLDDGELDHSYATTIHKAQGATVDRAFLLGSDTLYREAGYVGLSRARHQSDLYLVAGDPINDLERHLSRSHAQELAAERLEPRNVPNPAHDRRQARYQAVLADPADWAVTALGPPPLSGPGRERWAERAARIDAYRDVYAIDGPEPLGPQPDDPTQRRAWELARLAIREHTRSLELDQGLEL